MADKGPQHALLLNDHWHYSGVISGGLIKFIMMEGWEAGGFQQHSLGWRLHGSDRQGCCVWQGQRWANGKLKAEAEEECWSKCSVTASIWTSSHQTLPHISRQESMACKGLWVGPMPPTVIFIYYRTVPPFSPQNHFSELSRFLRSFDILKET